MRYIEVRRHTMRHIPGTHLTQRGVELARRVGNGIGPFARVLTSKLPRAFETAIAMGFAVDDQAGAITYRETKATQLMTGATTFADYANAIQQHQALTKWAKTQARFWHDIAGSLQDGESALLVSHGGLVEVGAIAALPDANYDAWGRGLNYCEGVRLSFDGNDFVSVEILRVDANERAAEKR